MTKRTIDMGIANTGFLLERLAEDCGPTQYLRELTQNAIEAIERVQRIDPGYEGKIQWDYDDAYLTKENVLKLSITDTGDGMTGEDMCRHINNLSSSGSIQGLQANFGIGAKITAVARNPEGVQYLSWKSGEGASVWMWRDPDTGNFGLKRQEIDEAWEAIVPLTDEAKPSCVKQHGTRVVLLGRLLQEDTTVPPEGCRWGTEWIVKSLNARYFRFPNGIRVTARTNIKLRDGEISDSRSPRRTVDGMSAFLCKASRASGTVALTDGVAHWWLLHDRDDYERARLGDWDTLGRQYIATGHAAVLSRDELYSMTGMDARTPRSRSVLQEFGITFGTESVVIYVEPKSVTTNTTRTQLLWPDGEPPWSTWGAEFRATLPAQLAEHVEALAARADKNCDKSIRERLAPLLNMYVPPRYVADGKGSRTFDPSTMTVGGASGIGVPKSKSGGSGTSGTKGGQTGNAYSDRVKPRGPSAREVTPDAIPSVTWISTKDGSRKPEELADRAAEFVRSSNLIRANFDFRVFEAIRERILGDFGARLGVIGVVDAAIKDWFGQQLVEAVLAMQRLRGSEQWTNEDIDKSLSPECLTAVAMPRYLALQRITQVVTTRIGQREIVPSPTPS